MSAQKKKVKWGVIGSGGIARRRTIPEGIMQAANAELVAVFDVAKQLNVEIAKEFNATATDELEDLLKADLDAVYIATPANLHFQHVIGCAGAGKHVLCEKPLGLSAEEGKKMVTACEKGGVNLGTAFMLRFHTQHKAALDMIEQGKLGTPVYGRAQMSCWYPPIKGAWRQDPAISGGGSLIDMGGHCIDLLEMFLGKVIKVSCFVGNIVHDYKSEDSAVAMLQFASGAMATVDNFNCIPDDSSKFVLELYGSKGSILAKNTVNQGDHGEMVAFLEEESSAYDAQQDHQDVHGTVVAPTPYNNYCAEIEEFSQAIIERRAPYNSAELGLRSERILSACYESARTGRAVDIGE